MLSQPGSGFEGLGGASRPQALPPSLPLSWEAHFYIHGAVSRTRVRTEISVNLSIFFFTWIHCKGIIKTCVFAKLKSKGLKTKRIKNVTLIFNVVDLFVPLDPSSWNITLPGNVIKHPNKLCSSCDACILVYPKTLYSSCRKMFL